MRQIVKQLTPMAQRTMISISSAKRMLASQVDKGNDYDKTKSWIQDNFQLVSDEAFAEAQREKMSNDLGLWNEVEQRDGTPQ